MYYILYLASVQADCAGEGKTEGSDTGVSCVRDFQISTDFLCDFHINILSLISRFPRDFRICYLISVVPPDFRVVLMCYFNPDPLSLAAGRAGRGGPCHTAHARLKSQS